MKIKINYTNNKSQIANYPSIRTNESIHRIANNILNLSTVASVTIMYNNDWSNCQTLSK